MPVTVREDPDLIPLCPHCSGELSEIVATAPPSSGSTSFKFGIRTVYACPRCRKALGISQRKTFWSG